MDLTRAIKAQHQTGDLGTAHIQNGNDPALHGQFAHVAHGALALIEVGHRCSAFFLYLLPDAFIAPEPV